LETAKKPPVKQKHAVAKVGDIAPGTVKIMEVERKSIGVYNISGSFYALRNICPHQGAELCKGLIKPLIISSEPGSFQFERENEIVRCPWHQWEFDIKTGQMIVDPAVRTASYDVSVEMFGVSVEEGTVYVHM
jgi:nitrite reductase (NADH) small subunit